MIENLLIAFNTIPILPILSLTVIDLRRSDAAKRSFTKLYAWRSLCHDMSVVLTLTRLSNATKRRTKSLKLQNSTLYRTSSLTLLKYCNDRNVGNQIGLGCPASSPSNTMALKPGNVPANLHANLLRFPVRHRTLRRKCLTKGSASSCECRRLRSVKSFDPRRSNFMCSTLPCSMRHVHAHARSVLGSSIASRMMYTSSSGRRCPIPPVLCVLALRL